MAESETRSLNQIRRETEATRANLTKTVDELRNTVTDTASEIKDRLRPEAIKAEVSDYFKSRGEQIFIDLKEAAHRNPMQAVAVGASMAYPLMRAAKSIPMSFLMIGAGLFFANSKAARNLTQQASDVANDLADKTIVKAQDLSVRVERASNDAGKYESQTFDNVTNAITGVADHLRSDVSGIPGAAATISDRLQHNSTEFAHHAADSIQGKIMNVSSAITNSVNSGKQSSQEFLQDARDQISEVSDRASRSFNQTIEQHPFLVAGLGLLVGGLIAGALPKFKIEDSLLGDASTAVKKRAQEVAADGFEIAKGAADEIIDSVVQQAQKDGLTSAALANGAEELIAAARSVADRAVNTVFDPDTQNRSESNGASHG